MKLYLFLPIISIFIASTLFYNESLSTPFIIKMGIVLLLLIVSVILLIRDIKRREIG